MREPIPVANCAGLPSGAFELLRRALCGRTSMRIALAWFFSHQPPLVPGDLIGQDEFSFDQLVPYPGGLFLSYDTT